MMELYNEYTKTNHLHKILERVQRQQKEDTSSLEQQLSAPSSPGIENGTRSNLNSPEPRGADLSIQSNNDPQDEVLDYSKGSSGKRRILVPTYQTSIFSGEFRNTTELQNFERLLELRCAKRKAEEDRDAKITESYDSPIHQNNNEDQKAPTAAHAALGMLAALAPMKLPRTESPPADKKDAKEDLTPYSPHSSQSRSTIIPSDIATNPLVAMQYLKCTNESQQRYELFRSGLLGKLDSNARESLSKDSNPYIKTNINSPPASSSSSSDHGSPPFSGSSSAYTKTDLSVSDDKINSSSKDQGYWEKRRKNNEAARRSRNVRKAKEQETALRAEFLEKENERIKMQLSLMTSHIVSCNCQPHATNQLKLCLQNNQML